MLNPINRFNFRPIPVLPTVYGDALSYEEQVSKIAKKVNECIEEINNFSPEMQSYVDEWLNAHPEATTTVEDNSLTLNKFSDELKESTLNVYVTPEMFGAIGDGVADDTVALQSAFLNPNPLYLNKTYLIDVADDTRLSVPSNKKVYGKGTIKIKGNEENFYCIVEVDKKENVEINGITIIGDSDTHLTSEGEYGFGIGIYDSKNVKITNVTVKNTWGDGIYFGKSTGNANSNIVVDKCSIYHCGRNCISVTNGNDIRITNCFISDAYRTTPKSCIDIEPNANHLVRNVIIEGCYFSLSKQGIQIAVSNASDIPISDGIIIANNIIEECEIPFYIGGTARNSASKLVIDNNNIINCDVALKSYRASYIFKNNTIEFNGNGDVGINCEWAYTEISGNHFSGNVTDCVIKIDSIYCSVNENTFTNITTEYLIKINGENTLIMNNSSNGSLYCSLFVINNSGVRVIGNKLGRTTTYIYVSGDSSYTVYSAHNYFVGVNYDDDGTVTVEQLFDVLNDSIIE